MRRKLTLIIVLVTLAEGTLSSQATVQIGEVGNSESGAYFLVNGLHVGDNGDQVVFANGRYTLSYRSLLRYQLYAEIEVDDEGVSIIRTYIERNGCEIDDEDFYYVIGIDEWDRAVLEELGPKVYHVGFHVPRFSDDPNREPSYCTSAGFAMSGRTITVEGKLTITSNPPGATISYSKGRGKRVFLKETTSVTWIVNFPRWRVLTIIVELDGYSPCIHAISHKDGVSNIHCAMVPVAVSTEGSHDGDIDAPPFRRSRVGVSKGSSWAAGTES